MYEIIFIYTAQVFQNFKHTGLNLEVAGRTDDIHLLQMFAT
jgi:hypothetical protein